MQHDDVNLLTFQDGYAYLAPEVEAGLLHAGAVFPETLRWVFRDLAEARA